MSADDIADLDALSPFELQDELARRAARSGAPRVLDAGKGQPNWLATTPRHAFHLLGRFAVGEARRHAENPDAGWDPDLAGVDARLSAFLDDDAGSGHAEDRHRERGADLLHATLDIGAGLGFDRQAWAAELVRGIIGDRYPWPHRMLSHVEELAHAYLVATHLGGDEPEGRFRLFATEGGAAAMTYVFQSLRRNGLLVPGDRIAVGTPVFSPYLQIPVLSEFGYEVVHVEADESVGWRYPAAELARLRDPTVKAFFLVNPGNPGTRALGRDEISVLAAVITDDRPDLILLTDTAYATFVEAFRSLLVEIPRHTIAVHSFSKHFGATGERLGFIAMHEDHVVDDLLREQGPTDRAQRARRYSSVTDDLDDFAFIDRTAADSRDVALYHIAGLSTPQQVQLALFAAFALTDGGREYIEMTRAVLLRRLRLLLDPLEVDLPTGPDTHYYTLIDAIELARRRHGDAFADWLVVTQHPLAFPLGLAERHGVVALPGRGFEATSWSVRVSLANLPDDGYPAIAAALQATTDDLHAGYADTHETDGPHDSP